MSEKILRKKCPHCNDQIDCRVEDDEFLETNVRLFGGVVCAVCGSFAQQLAQLKELKIEAWTLLERLEKRHERLERSIAANTHSKSAYANASKISAELKECRQTVQKLTEKEEDVLNRRSLHEQQLKERTAI